MSGVPEKPAVAYKKAPSSFREFQQCVVVLLRRLSPNFTLEDFEKSFRATYGPKASTFHFKDLRSVLAAVPHIVQEGETFSYRSREPIKDAIGRQKLEYEIYEVIKDFQAQFPAVAVSRAYFARYWEQIPLTKFGFQTLHSFLLSHPALEPVGRDIFKISGSLENESEQRKEEKLKALKTRILEVVSYRLAMPFIAKGIESAYEKHFKEKMVSPAEFGYESLLELLDDHPDLEKVVAADFFDVACFKLKNLDVETTYYGHCYTVFDRIDKNWLLSEIEKSNSTDNHNLPQPFPLNEVIDSSWEEFLPQIFDFLTKRRSYKSFLVDGVEWLYKPSEDERNSLEVGSECHTVDEERDEQISRVVRFLRGKASVSLLQRTFRAVFKKAISVADIIAMVSSKSKDYRLAWLQTYKKDSYVIDKRLHESDGVEQNVRRFVQAINDCGGDVSLPEVIKRWEFISGSYASGWEWMSKIFECDSLQELREILPDEILILVSPQEELRFQNKTPPIRTEIEEGTRRLLEILKECEKGKRLCHSELFDKHKMKYAVDFNLNELWRYFEVSKPLYLRPLLAKAQIVVRGKTSWGFRIWLPKENNEDGVKDDEDEMDEPRRAIKRKAEELTEQSAKKKLVDVATETEENAGKERSIAAKETMKEGPVAKPLENEVEDVRSKKNTTKFREEAVQTETSDPPSIPMDTSSFAPPVALPPTSKHAPLGNLVVQMLDYAEYKGKNTEELGTKILKMIIESSE